MLCAKEISIRFWRKAFLFGIVVASFSWSSFAWDRAVFRTSTESAKWIPEQNLTIANGSSQTNEVVIDTAAANLRQTIDAWGGSPNEIGCEAMHHLPAALQDSIVKALFDTVTGARFNQIRLPMGCSDFSLTGYTLNDNAGDTNMTKISIDREKPMALKFIKDAMKYYPSLKVWTSPWTGPNWMKNNGVWYGGGANTDECALKSDPAIRRAYVKYFVRATELYREYGIPLYAVSMQNEPRVCQPFPSMRWSGGILIRDFMKMLGEGLTARFKDSVELWTPTMNVADHSYFSPMLDDTYLKTVIKAVGLQYEGRDALVWLRTTYPNVKYYYTEMVCGGGDNQWSFAFDPSFKDIKFYLDNGASGCMYWNLLLEKNGNSGPMVNFKQNACITMDTVAKTFTRQPVYWVMKHVAYYLRPGSRVIRMTGSYAGSTLAVLHPDKSIGVVMQNLNSGATTVAVRFGSQMVTTSLPGRSFASFRIYNSVGVQTASSGVKMVHKQTGSFKVAGDVFILPAAISGTENQIAIYDLQGKLLHSSIMKGRIIDLERNCGLRNGSYVVRVNSDNL